MRYAIFFGFFFIVCTTGVFSRDGFRVMFYNVENLFDTKDDPLKNDDDFLPDGFMRWTPRKYREKLRDITRVITAVGEMQSPALVGLCEVENDSVLFDLTRESPLRAQEYKYIITRSPDERGINVALLYQRHQFKLLEFNEYEIRFNRPDQRPTRNILHAVGELVNGDTLDVLVCHFPSRSGGERETEPARIQSATLLKEKTDSIISVRTRPYCIIMGDFNDPPGSRSLLGTLQANRPWGQNGRKVLEEHEVPEKRETPCRVNALYNLFFDYAKERECGTYKYQGRWEVIDQFIVSGSLLTEENSVHVKGLKAYIFDADFLLENDDKYYGKKPFRTSSGPRYLGGFSDHLPVYMDLTIYN